MGASMCVVTSGQTLKMLRGEGHHDLTGQMRDARESKKMRVEARLTARGSRLLGTRRMMESGGAGAVQTAEFECVCLQGAACCPSSCRFRETRRKAASRASTHT